MQCAFANRLVLIHGTSSISELMVLAAIERAAQAMQLPSF